VGQLGGGLFRRRGVEGDEVQVGVAARHQLRQQLLRGLADQELLAGEQVHGAFASGVQVLQRVFELVTHGAAYSPHAARFVPRVDAGAAREAPFG
jgi:hypothetical protein